MSECRLAIGHGSDSVAGLLQVQHDEVANVGLVFGHENAVGNVRTVEADGCFLHRCDLPVIFGEAPAR